MSGYREPFQTTDSSTYPNWDSTVNVTLTVQCPKCKTQLTYPSGNPYYFCPYCGEYLHQITVTSGQR